MYYKSQKVEADALRKVEIWWLRRNDCLLPGYHSRGATFGRYGISENMIITSCIFNDEKKYLELKSAYFEYKIFITETPCYFGGIRKWFLCPLIRMGAQ